ncbi:MAG: sulfotransferase [Pseudomonadota bacterium]
MMRDRAADVERLKSIHAVAVGGDFPAAARLATSALAEGLEHPFLLNLVATVHEQEGRLDEALVLLERAVALAPEDLGARNALGLCLRRLERPEEALAHLRWVAQKAPEHAFAHASLGDILQMLGALSEADACYAAALARDAQHPIALAGRAMVASLRGDMGAARRWGLQALAVMPTLPDAVLAVATAELADDAREPAVRRLRALLAAGQLMPLEKARVLGLLGDALDASLQPHLAYVAYQECNEILRAAHAPRMGSGRSASGYVRDLLDYFVQSDPVAWAARTPATEAPADHVFLIGFPRSGTTLLEVILEGHPDVVTLEEKELFFDAALHYMAQTTALDSLASASEEELDRYRAAYWDAARVAGVAPEGKVFVDKYPLNILKLPLIARLFPNAKILLARRDPRDVVLSCFRRRFRMSPPLYELLTLEGGARYYDLVMTLEQRLLSFFKLPTHVVWHEHLLDDFAGEMQAICTYLGIQWTPKMGAFAQRAKQRATATPSTAQLAGGLSRKGLGHWRRYADELRPVLPVLAPWVKAYGYD